MNTKRTPSSRISPSRPATDAAFRSLLRTLGLLKRVMEPYFTRFGISGAQWSVLRTLHRAEEDGSPQLRLTDLGERLLIRPASVTGVVDRLQRNGLLSRSAWPADQRVKHVSLTPGGRKLIERILEQHATQIKAVLAGLSEHEQHQLHQLLERLGTHLEAMTQRQELLGVA